MFDFGNANDGQRQAISTTEGPVLITAGPGTGKTYTLVQRAIYLIEERGVKPEDIFIATFTEKAAKELITRITNELASRNITVNVNEMYVGTFHSLCLRIIKEHLEYTRLKKNYRLLDTFDQQYLVFRNIYKFRMLSGIENVMPKGGAWKWAQAICEFSNNLTEEVVDIDAMLGDHDMEISVIAKVVNTYQAMLDEENLIDFSAIQTECYRLLTEKHSTENPLMVYQFIYALLNQAILLPITADTQDTALTIFSTLNDRGLPLSDADIFKAKIYNQLAPDDKKAFIDRWKDLDEQSTDANESIQQLFYYNMFYYRALDKDTKTTTPGVRKYYATNKFERLYKPELLDTLFVILNLWKVVNKGEELEDEAWSKNTKIRQTLDILTSYPNEYWKYPVVIYYVCYRNEENFETRFARFLNKLLMELMTKYLMIPTINAVKPDILKLNSAIVASDIPTFEFKTADMTQLEPYIQNPNRNAVRMLLKTLAYEHQDDLLPAKWEIEHIFPQKWQTNYFPDEPDATIKEKIEHIGNKLPFEKKLNIVAGNGYFGKKKKEYTASKIVITKAMGTSDVMDWNLESITKRDIRVSDEVVKIMNRWNNEYLNIPISEGKMGEPSEEELAQIEKFKKNGWI